MFKYWSTECKVPHMLKPTHTSLIKATHTLTVNLFNYGLFSDEISSDYTASTHSEVLLQNRRLYRKGLSYQIGQLTCRLGHPLPFFNLILKYNDILFLHHLHMITYFFCLHYRFIQPLTSAMVIIHIHTHTSLRIYIHWGRSIQSYSISQLSILIHTNLTQFKLTYDLI